MVHALFRYFPVVPATYKKSFLSPLLCCLSLSSKHLHVSVKQLYFAKSKVLWTCCKGPGTGVVWGCTQGCICLQKCFFMRIARQKEASWVPGTQFQHTVIAVLWKTSQSLSCNKDEFDVALRKHSYDSKVSLALFSDDSGSWKLDLCS